jgi:inhibitor of cysteine peptidase
MRTIVRVLLVCAVAAASIASAGCTTPGGVRGPLKVGESANGTTVDLVMGQTLEVSLPANPTTGFDWAYGTPVPSQLTTVSDSYETTAPAGVVGAGGVHTFVLKATTDGTATVRLGYARPWESVPPEKTFDLTVVVRKPGI